MSAPAARDDRLRRELLALRERVGALEAQPPAGGPGFDARQRLGRVEAELAAVQRGFVALLRVVEQHAARLDARLPAPEAARLPLGVAAPEPQCRTCGTSLAGRRPQTRSCNALCRQRGRRHASVTVSGATPPAG